MAAAKSCLEQCNLQFFVWCLLNANNGGCGFYSSTAMYMHNWEVFVLKG